MFVISLVAKLLAFKIRGQKSCSLKSKMFGVARLELWMRTSRFMVRVQFCSHKTFRRIMHLFENLSPSFLSNEKAMEVAAFKFKLCSYQWRSMFYSILRMYVHRPYLLNPGA